MDTIGALLKYKIKYLMHTKNKEDTEKCMDLLDHKRKVTM